jgi:hypothetical protein
MRKPTWGPWIAIYFGLAFAVARERGGERQYLGGVCESGWPRKRYGNAGAAKRSAVHANKTKGFARRVRKAVLSGQEETTAFVKLRRP